MSVERNPSSVATVVPADPAPGDLQQAGVKPLSEAERAALSARVRERAQAAERNSRVGWLDAVVDEVKATGLTELATFLRAQIADPDVIAVSRPPLIVPGGDQLWIYVDGAWGATEVWLNDRRLSSPDAAAPSEASATSGRWLAADVPAGAAGWLVIRLARPASDLPSDGPPARVLVRQASTGQDVPGASFELSRQDPLVRISTYLSLARYSAY